MFFTTRVGISNLARGTRAFCKILECNPKRVEELKSREKIILFICLYSTSINTSGSQPVAVVRK